MGLTRFELVTPRLSSVCSNQLSYRPSDSAKATSDKPTITVDEPRAQPLPRDLPTVAQSAKVEGGDSFKTR